MNEVELTLDGNAIAGLLAELFGREMTIAQSACKACGAVEALGALTAYVHAPGVVIRCRHCETVLMVAVRTRATYRVAFADLGWLELHDELPDH